MTEYVLCCAITHGFNDRWVLVVKKKSPEWQRGRLNLPGGHIEAGETACKAAHRELLEETGYRTSMPSESGRIVGPDYVCTVVLCDLLERTPVTSVDEDFCWMSYDTALRSPLLIPNLRLILPLVYSGVRGWVLKQCEDGLSPNWLVTLPEVRTHKPVLPPTKYYYERAMNRSAEIQSRERK